MRDGQPSAIPHRPEVLGRLVASPALPAALVEAAILAHRRRDPQAALRLLTRRRIVEPALAAAHLQLGQLLFDLRQIRQAVAALRRAMLLDPSERTALSGLARILARNRRAAQVRLAIGRARCLGPLDGRERQMLFDSLVQLKAFGAAGVEGRRRVALDPADAGTIMLYADVMSRQGGKPEAIRWLLHHGVLQPTSAAGASALSRALFSSRSYEAALVHRRRAIALGDEGAQGRFELARILRALEQFAEADAAMAEAIRIDPTYELNRRVLALTVTAADFRWPRTAAG